MTIDPNVPGEIPLSAEERTFVRHVAVLMPLEKFRLLATIEPEVLIKLSRAAPDLLAYSEGHRAVNWFYTKVGKFLLFLAAIATGVASWRYLGGGPAP